MAKKFLEKKIPMPEQSPKERIKNFDEVALGYTVEMAVEEAKRCLQCKPKEGQKFVLMVVLLELIFQLLLNVLGMEILMRLYE